MLLLDYSAANLQPCINACIICAKACNKCFKECLEKDNLNELKEALSILVDCAEICYVTAVYMSKDNTFSEELSNSCAELCEKCASICERYEDLSCQDTVAACKRCAEVCKELAI
jgi:triphosphoribosyl-dephospho-CoA synthetase